MPLHIAYTDNTSAAARGSPGQPRGEGGGACKSTELGGAEGVQKLANVFSTSLCIAIIYLKIPIHVTSMYSN